MTSTPAQKRFFVLEAKPFTESGISVMARGILAIVEAHKSTGAEMGNIGAVLHQSGDDTAAVIAAIYELESKGLLNPFDNKIQF